MGISTHILDTTLGRPAVDLPVQLSFLDGGEWTTLADTRTDADGRCKHLLPADQPLTPGVYCVRFETGVHYEREHAAGLYPFVEVVFTALSGEDHYHIPLLLTANGYTTYRGS